MEVIERTISYKRSDEYRIYPLGDIHAGSIHCAEGAIKEEVQTIATQKNSLWLGMGDYADCIIKDDKRFDIGGLADWVQKDNILESQRVWLRELFNPIKDKCLGLITGNHEEDIHTKYQMDFTRNLCKDLGVNYAGYQCFVSLSFTRNGANTHNYITHAWHGSGAAQTEGARLMRLMRLVNDFQAHIYLMGHLHTITQHTPDRVVCQRGRIKSVRLMATITGSWLRGYTQPKKGESINPSYVEQKGYKPSRIGCPIIYIKPWRDRFSIES